MKAAPYASENKHWILPTVYGYGLETQTVFMHNRNPRRSFPFTEDRLHCPRDLLQTRHGSRVAALLSNRALTA